MSSFVKNVALLRHAIFFMFFGGKGCNFFLFCDVFRRITTQKQLFFADCTDPQMLDQKSNDWRSIFLWLNIVLNLKRK